MEKPQASIAGLAAELTRIEGSVEAAIAAIGRLDIALGRTTVVTGAPGAGKSTLINRLIEHLGRRGERVGAILIDPTSALTGGAVLGDRVRMLGAGAGSQVFIRSVAARNGSEGIGIVAPIMAWTLLNAGFDHVLIESVGIGQQELDVARRGEVLALALGPDSGDWVQFIKSGILDLCHLIALTKSDHGIQEVVTEVTQAVRLQSFRRDPLPVCPVSSLSGEGIADLVAAIDAQHRMPQTQRIEARSAIARDILARLVGEHARCQFERNLARHDGQDWQSHVAEAQRFMKSSERTSHEYQ